MIEIEHDDVADTYDASASVYECGWCTRREALVALRAELKRLIIECDNMIREEETDD